MRRLRITLAAVAATSLSVAALAASFVAPKAEPTVNLEALGGDTTKPVTGDQAFTFMATNAKAEHQRDFFFGNRLFNTNWVIAPASVKSFDGLGPFFNRVSCSGCHTRDGRGQPPETMDQTANTMLIRLSIPDPHSPNGTSPHPIYGDQLSEDAIPGVKPEGRMRVTYEKLAGSYGDGTAFELSKPTYTLTDLAYGPLGNGVMLSPRVASQVIGLGLLEAIPRETLERMSDPDDRDHDGISGRVNHVPNAVTGKVVEGRFGWKANQANLETQNAGAAFGDIGLTSLVHKSENCGVDQPACSAAPIGSESDLSDKFLAKLNLYTRLLAVPAQRNPNDLLVKAGERLFTTLGCSSCHAPTQKTGSETILPELANQIFHPFTDLLLHDMGEGLADGRPDFEASGSEWRTPPLWGIGLFQAVNGHDRLMHDGRARGPAEAILWHGGEAEKSKEAFRNADRADRDALIAFLNSL